MNKKGFTLIELLATIVILGLIMTIVATKGFGAFDNSKNAIGNLNENAIKEAAEVLKVDIEHCDDEIDSELLNSLDSLSDIQKDQETQKVTCFTANETLNSDSCINTTFAFLIENDYISGSDLKDYNSEDTIKICSNGIIYNPSKNKNDEPNVDEQTPNNILSDVIIQNATNNLNSNGTGTKLSDPITKVADETSRDDEKVLSKTKDNYGESYYFRGNVVDNYVNFSGMCWRIVRIEGNKSVKIILADKDYECSSDTLTKNGSALIGDNINNCYQQKNCYNYGYTFNLGNIYVQNFLNPTENSDYSLKYNLDRWKNLKNIKDDFLSYDTWCLGDLTSIYDANGNSLLTPQETLMSSHNNFFYDSDKRLCGKGFSKSASLECNGGKTFQSYIGTLTADEVVFAGGRALCDGDPYSSGNESNYYLYDNAKTNRWWTLSLGGFNINRNRAFDVEYNGKLTNDGYIDANFNAIRPVISLKAGIEISSGDGTVANPYELRSSNE